MYYGIQNYLRHQGLWDDYAVTLVNKPDFPWIAKEVMSAENVILLLGFWQERGSGNWVRINGHFITVSGVDLNNLKIALSDPGKDAAETGGAGRILNGSLISHAPVPGHSSQVHTDAGNVSHDIYSVSAASQSPGGNWYLPDYEPNALLLENDFIGINPNPKITETVGAYDDSLPIHVKIEYALAFSPYDWIASGRWVKDDAIALYNKTFVPYNDFAPSGMPDIDQKQDSWGKLISSVWQWTFSGPVAAANTFWWFDSKFEFFGALPTIITDTYPLLSPSYGAWDDHDPQNVDDPATIWPSDGEIIEDLAYLFNTDGSRTGTLQYGTPITDIYYGIDEYITNHNLRQGYVITQVEKPNYWWVAEETEWSGDVLLLLGFYAGTGDGTFERVGGHYVSVAGVDKIGGSIALSDPYWDRMETIMPPNEFSQTPLWSGRVGSETNIPLDEATPVDLVLVFDTSESMASDINCTDDGVCTPGYNINDFDPSTCNAGDTCYPMRQNKDAAKGLIDNLFIGYDRVAVVQYDYDAQVIEPLNSNLNEVTTAISSVGVHNDASSARTAWYSKTDPIFGCTHAVNPIFPDDRDGDGSDIDYPTCVDGYIGKPIDGVLGRDLWDDITGQPCDANTKLDTYDSDGDGDWSDENNTETGLNIDVSEHYYEGTSLLSTCIGCGLRVAMEELQDHGRSSSLKVIVFVTDGLADLSDTNRTNNEIPTSFLYGFCGHDTSPLNSFLNDFCIDYNTTCTAVYPNTGYCSNSYVDDTRYCIDTDSSECPPSSASTTTSRPYSVADYAQDVSDAAALLVSYNENEPLGEGITLFSIGLKAAVNGAPLLRYIANIGEDGSRENDSCLGVPSSENCGNYFYAPQGSELDQIYQSIALNISTERFRGTDSTYTHNISHLETTIHNYAANVSHDIYDINSATSAGGTWGLNNYIISTSAITNFVSLNGIGVSFPNTTPIQIEVEWAIAISPVSDLWITKTITPTEVSPGETVTITLQFGNKGNLAENVIIEDLLSSNFTNASVSGAWNNYGGIITSHDQYTFSMGDVPFSINMTNIGIITITAQINPDISWPLTSTIINTASISSDTQEQYQLTETPNTDSFSLTVQTVLPVDFRYFLPYHAR